jgi:hypothetical protein
VSILCFLRGKSSAQFWMPRFQTFHNRLACCLEHT